LLGRSAPSAAEVPGAAPPASEIVAEDHSASHVASHGVTGWNEIERTHHFFGEYSPSEHRQSVVPSQLLHIPVVEWLIEALPQGEQAGIEDGVEGAVKEQGDAKPAAGGSGRRHGLF